MTELAMGANAPLPDGPFTLDVALPDGASIDVTALVLYPGGKVRGDGDMCFFNQPSVSDGALVLTTAPARASFACDLRKLPADAEKVVVTAALESGTFGAVGGLRIAVSGGPSLAVDTGGRSEAALILCELYRRNGQWKIRNVSQGFNGGLRALAEHFGVEIAAPAASPLPSRSPAPAPAPKPSPPRAPSTVPPVSLSKVSLTKAQSTVSLKKDDGRFGKIRVNLDWNQKKTGGFLGMGKRGLDLDLGAFVEGARGEVTAVQALGDTFGRYDGFPHARLLADDRTGAAAGGEWMEIDGDAWRDIRRILIYAFIYEGAADWQETDGVVRVIVPGQPEVEVRMNEYDAREGMCAVALLENDGGQIRVSREVRFFRGHEAMDDAYGWGMRWRAGRK